ncbi:MAG: zinc-ribbon domain-containing protein, partial [Myxococcaceae bacterium]
MDVRCERCKTEYEFDDARITEAGVAVKCTTCGHVFKVKKKALVVTVPVKPGELETAGIPAISPPVQGQVPSPSSEKQRDWKVRQASGNVFTFKELTTLQKWIVERKVARDDEISLTGETWKRLGNIAELASFFQVVDEAQKGAQLQALQAQGLLGNTSPSVPVTPPPAEEALPEPPLTPARVSAPEPAFTQNSMAVRTAERRSPDGDAQAAVKRSGGAGKGFATLLVLAALGAGGYYGYFHYWLPMQANAAAGTA